MIKCPIMLIATLLLVITAKINHCMFDIAAYLWSDICFHVVKKVVLMSSFSMPMRGLIEPLSEI